MKTKIWNQFYPWSALLMATTFLFACDLKKDGQKVTNAGAKSTRTCEAYSTENQADAQNQVIRPGIDYGFALKWDGPASKFTLNEDNMIDDKFELSFDPLKIHVLDANNAQTEEIACTQDKANATKCVTRLEKVLKLIKEARESLATRRAHLSSGKGFTFKCTQEFAEKKILELKQIQ